MYCPNCATPIDGAKFCRSCGSNVSLVPQAMSGQLPQFQASDGKLHFEIDHRQGSKVPGIESILTELFAGIAFVIASISILAWVPAGVFWWWSLLFPAFMFLGDSIGKYLRWKESQRKQSLLERAENQTINQSTIRAASFSAPTTSELDKPSSVTEQTTRHLE
jgi:hypothetical protein